MLQKHIVLVCQFLINLQGIAGKKKRIEKRLGRLIYTLNIHVRRLPTKIYTLK